MVVVAGYLNMSAKPWSVTRIVDGLPHAIGRSYGFLSREAGGTGAFVSIIGGGNYISIEVKNNRISKENVFFSIAYITS